MYFWTHIQHPIATFYLHSISKISTEEQGEEKKRGFPKNKVKKADQIWLLPGL